MGIIMANWHTAHRKDHAEEMLDSNAVAVHIPPLKGLHIGGNAPTRGGW